MRAYWCLRLNNNIGRSSNGRTPTFEVENLGSIPSLPASLVQFWNSRSIVYKFNKTSMKTILVDAVDCFVSDTGVIFKEMHYLLETYSNKKNILTGASDEQFKKFGLNKMPYEVFTLKHNPEKTDPKYYEILLKYFGLSKDDVIYFEHNPKAVESAQSIGIISYYYDNNHKDLNSLKGFLDLNLSSMK